MGCVVGGGGGAQADGGDSWVEQRPIQVRHDALTWLILIQQDMIGSHFFAKHLETVHFVNINLGETM